MLFRLSLAVAVLPFCSAQLDYYAKKAGLKYFGTATDSPGQRERAGQEAAYPQYDAILRDTKEFGQMTPANGQKWMYSEPEKGVFNFTEGDIVADIAAKTGQMLRCHALVWHNQLPPWMENGNWTASALRPALAQHVTRVAEYYKGRCYAWDVVNEALADNGTYRDSLFYKVLGDEYIRIAFAAAAKADPHAKLYYNDYSIERQNSTKHAGAVRIVKMLKNAGIRIDGVGLQAHFTAKGAPSLDAQIDALQDFTALGVEVALTELDVRIELPLNATNLEWQYNSYKNVKGCIGVTIWDFYDPFSWVPATFPGQGAPLLWFDDFKKHPAYYGALEALKNKTGDPGCKPSYSHWRRATLSS